MKHLSILLTICGLQLMQVQAQDQANDILKALLNRMDRIESYDVKAIIKVDVDFIDISDREINISFKSPDQFSFKAEGLALLPKNGIQMEYLALLREDFTALDTGTETYQGVVCRQIKIIPESEKADIILAQLLIDPSLPRIMKMKTFTRKSGSYEVFFFYEADKLRLPKRIEVEFEINDMTVMAKMINEFMGEGAKTAEDVPKQAKVIIEYGEYKIVEKK